MFAESVVEMTVEATVELITSERQISPSPRLPTQVVCTVTYDHCHLGILALFDVL